MIKLKQPEEYISYGYDVKTLVTLVQKDVINSIIEQLSNKDMPISSPQPICTYPVKKILKKGYLKNMTISLPSTYVEKLIAEDQSVEILCQEPGFKGTSTYTPEELKEPEWKNPTIFEDKYTKEPYQLWVYKWKNL